MRKYIQSLLLLLGLLALPTIAAAQASVVTVKTISTAGADCSTATNCAIFGVREYPAIGIYVNVATSGTFVFEATTGSDASTAVWFAISDDIGAAGTATADGYVTFTNPGYSYIRLRASAINGAATITAARGYTGLKSTASLSGAAQGDGAIQDGANSAIEATVFDFTNSNPVSVHLVDANGDAASVGGGTQFAEDAVHSSGATGTLALVVRQDTATQLAGTNGDYSMLITDSSGRLHVNVGNTVTVSATDLDVQSGGADILSTTAFNAAFGTAGTADTQVISIQGIASMTPVTVSDGSGALNVICDSGCAGGTQFAEDAASANADIGTLALARRTATPANTSGADLDYEVLQMSAGRLWTSTVLTDGTDTALVDGSGNLAVTCSNCSGSGVSVNEDVASADAHPGTPAYTVRNDTVTGATSTDGDYQPMKSDSAGRIYVTGVGGSFPITDGAGALNVIVDSGTVTTVSTVTSVSQLGGVALPIEDAAETAAGVGIYAMSVRRDTAASSAGTTGDNATINTDSTGRLWTRPTGGVTPADNFSVPADAITVWAINGCYDGSTIDLCRAASTTEATHDAALTPGSTVGGVGMILAKDFDGAALPNAVSAEGDAVIPAASLSGVQYVMIVSEDGALERGTSTTPMVVGDGSGALNIICDSGCSGGTQYTHDAALTIGTSLTTLSGARASAAVPTDVSADNDAVALWALRSGALAIQPTLGGILASANSGNVGTGVQRVVLATDQPAMVGLGIYAEDAAETAGGNLSMAGTVRRDTAATSAGATGDNATANTDATGLLWARHMDPCTALNPTTVPVSVAADTAVISAGGASTRTYICGGVLVAGAAEIVNIWEGTGTACGTSSAALAGSTTEANGMSLAANGGFEISRTIRGIGTNVDVCIRLSTTNRVAGWLSYVQVAQ